VRLTPPKNVTWTLALLLLVLGVLAKQMPLPSDLSAYAFWLVVASSVLLSGSLPFQRDIVPAKKARHAGRPLPGLPLWLG
jgi:hypothetical protein